MLMQSNTTWLYFLLAICYFEFTFIKAENLCSTSKKSDAASKYLKQTTEDTVCDSESLTLQGSSDDGGWDSIPRNTLLTEGPCTIDTLSEEGLPWKKFINEYAYTKPFIVKGASRNKLLQSLTRKDQLINTHGATIILLSSANSYSYEKQHITFEEYCKKNILPQSIHTLANETFYFFGDNANENWNDLYNAYEPPPYHLPQHQSQLSFGVAGSGSGVPFHFHGPGFAETLWGRKRWFMYNPDGRPAFHPNRTTLQWLHEQYPLMKDDPLLTECTLHPGEIIYFPDHWWHATLNLDAAVFMSTFLSP